MRRTVLTFLLALGALAGAASAAGPEHARMTIGEESYRVPLGKPFAVMLAGERVTMRIDPEDSRSLAVGGVSFRYPRDFSSDVNADDPNVRVWTMQGRRASVILQRYAGDLDPESLRDAQVENLVERRGAGRVRRQAVNLRGAEASFAGVQVVARGSSSKGAGRTEEVQNVFTFAAGDAVFALMVQDARPTGAGDSAEYTEAIRLLGESLKTGAKDSGGNP